MRVLLSMLLITLTIASVHLQLCPILIRFDWAYWVHKALTFVCLAQFTMVAVWAATARGGGSAYGLTGWCWPSPEPYRSLLG